MSMAATISLLAVIPNSPLLKPEKKRLILGSRLILGKTLSEKEKKREKTNKKQLKSKGRLKKAEN